MAKVIALSNPFEILPQIEACDTLVVEYSADTNSFGFDYALLDNPIQSIRLHLYLSNPQPVTSEKIYRGTNGVFKNNNVKIDKKYTLQTGYFDQKIHDAMLISAKHSTFKINSIDYSAQGNYDIDDRTDLTQINLTMAKVDVFEQGYNKTNLSC